MTPGNHSLVGLVAGFRGGDKGSTDRLIEALYPELRRLARARMRRERTGHSWQPTELVNELYLELAKLKAFHKNGNASSDERSAFLGLAGFMMWRLLVAHSRPLRQRVEKADADELELLAAANPTADRLQIVEELLAKLESVDPRLRTVVELRVFEGMTNEEIAGQLQCSSRTVGTCWAFARQWLEAELGTGAGYAQPASDTPGSQS